MTEEQKTDFIPMDELMARTGLSKRQIHNDIRRGLMPGRMDRGRAMVARRQYERWLEGDELPRVRPAASDFVRRVKDVKLLRYGEEVDLN